MDCGCSLEPPCRGGSNEYPQSMFLSRNKENNVYPCKPHFYYIKVGFKGVKLYRYVFMMSYRLPRYLLPSFGSAGLSVQAKRFQINFPSLRR